MKYRRWILLAGLTSTALVACPQPPAPPAPVVVNCNNSPTFEPASSVTVTGVTTDASTRVVDAADISSVETNRLQVAETGGAFKAGELVVSECNEGLIRKISGIQPAVSGQQLSPLGIKKVYIQTEDATLEDVISAGDATINFGDTNLDNGVTTMALPGIKVQAVTGKLGFTNVKVPLPGGSSVTMNGFVQQSLDPQFNMTFSKGSLEKLRISIKGNLTAKLEGILETGGKLSGQVPIEKAVYESSITRAFLVGAVPVVVVIQPKLLVGAMVGADEKMKVTAGIAPTVTMNFDLSYDRNRAGSKWAFASNPLNLALNPTFSVTTPQKGDGKAYSKLVLGVKFYGIAGPELEVKPYLDTDLLLNKTAKFRTGISAAGSVKAGFKVLGKGLELGSDPLSSVAANNYNCTITACTLQ
jgi:hypothetical protein